LDLGAPFRACQRLHLAPQADGWAPFDVTLKDTEDFIIWAIERGRLPHCAGCEWTKRPWLRQEVSQECWCEAMPGSQSTSTRQGVQSGLTCRTVPSECSCHEGCTASPKGSSRCSSSTQWRVFRWSRRRRGCVLSCHPFSIQPFLSHRDRPGQNARTD
jgi:hypothetical protein